MLNIIGVKLKQREDIFQVKSIFNRTVSRTHFQNITRYLHHQTKYGCSDSSVIYQFYLNVFTQEIH